MSYDLIVIGGGPAGYLAAERAGRGGLKTLLIEERSVGGVCLNEGCIPSKTLLYSAKLLDGVKYGEKYGVSGKDLSLDHQRVVARKNRVVRSLVAGVKNSLKKNGVQLVQGVGEITGKSNEGFRVKVNGDEFIARRLLIATGSTPIVPHIAGVEEGLSKGFVLTSREILDLQEIPESLVIIGGGVIGLEMASYFNSAGSKVTVVEMLDHIAGDTDSDISRILQDNYRKNGVDFRLNSKVVEICRGSVIYESHGEKSTVSAEKVLLSIGRKPAVQGIGLERIGVETAGGRINTDERGRTNIANVYAAGDVNGRSMLAHTAYREAEVCVNNILGRKDIMRYHAVPSVIYTNPEVAAVGETEETAKAKGIEYDSVVLPLGFSGRYVAENEGGNGICKLLVEKKRRTLIGVHLIANYASEIIFGASAMIEMELRTDDIKEIIFPHPTVSEIIREGVFSL